MKRVAFSLSLMASLALHIHTHTHAINVCCTNHSMQHEFNFDCLQEARFKEPHQIEAKERARERKKWNKKYASSTKGAIASFQWNDFIHMIYILLSYTFIQFDWIRIESIRFVCILCKLNWISMHFIYYDNSNMAQKNVIDKWIMWWVQMKIAVVHSSFCSSSSNSSGGCCCFSLRFESTFNFNTHSFMTFCCCHSHSHVQLRHTQAHA